MSVSLKQQTFNGTLWAGVGKLFSMANSFVLTFILVNSLVPSEYGAFYIALSTIVILSGIAPIGMDQVVVRFAALRSSTKSWRDVRQVVHRCFWITAAGAIVVTLVFLLYAVSAFRGVLHVPELAVNIGILAMWIISATTQRQLAETFRGLNDIRAATLYGGVRNSGIVNAVLASGMMIALWATGRLTLRSALLVMLAASLIVVVLAIASLRHQWRKHTDYDGDSACAERLSIGEALVEGWPLWLSGAIIVLNALGSAWIAAAVDSGEHVALYGVAYRSMHLILAPMVVVYAVLPPVISRLHANQEMKRLESIMRSMCGVLFLGTLFLLVILVFVGKPLLGAVFGSYYESAYVLMLLLCMAQATNVASGGWQIVLAMTGKRHELLLSSIITLVVQVGAGIVLGLAYGVYGVAVSFLVSRCVCNLVGVGLVRRALGIWCFASLNITTMKQTVKDICGQAVVRLNKSVRT